MSMRSPLGRVRGLGSARDGVGHWWAERMTALALIPLVLWFVASVVMITGADYATVRAWIASPVVAGLLVLLVVMAFTHAALGLQTIVEDYVQHEGAKLAVLLAIKAFALLLGLTGVLAVLTILFGG
ncbi:MAG: succinate dehydrogenase, hydrophobic membrane anchor protein [Proteobacteria bacterium]|nr:succinate dehydrogenase, hydrophobic membrane anchor protein [Pseudomonadota bacterium]